MISVSELQIDEALSKVKAGLERYCWIQGNLQRCDVVSDHIFRSRFNHFYRVRRNGSWQNCFYNLLEKRKTIGIAFPVALHELVKATSRIEASFASKLVATIHPEMPVIDKFVLNNFGLHLPFQYSRDRERGCVRVYNQLCESYSTFMKTDQARKIREKFESIFPWAQITNVKKIDLVLWQIRDETA